MALVAFSNQDNLSHNRGAAFEPASAIFPGHVAPVVRQNADGEREIVLMSWGFVLLRNGRAPTRVTNVRDDKILESRFWRGWFEERRFRVPATSFCEPNGDIKPARCLIPGFDGAPMSSESKDALWARFFMAAPRRQRQSVERYSIVKRA